MSKFYSNYCENNNKEKPSFLQREERIREIEKQHLYQAKMTTNGKHTGSKGKHKTTYLMHRATNNINRIISGYNG